MIFAEFCSLRVVPCGVGGMGLSSSLDQTWMRNDAETTEPEEEKGRGIHRGWQSRIRKQTTCTIKCGQICICQLKARGGEEEERGKRLFPLPSTSEGDLIKVRANLLLLSFPPSACADMLSTLSLGETLSERSSVGKGTLFIHSNESCVCTSILGDNCQIFVSDFSVFFARHVMNVIL